MAGDAVNQSLLELSAILENATVGILFTRARKVARANPLCAHMFGYPMAEFIGLAGIDLYPGPEDYEAVGALAGPVLGAGRSFQTETRMRRRDGSLFWCRISAKAIDPHHPQAGTIWILENTDEDRAMREALARTSRELEAVFDTAVVGICVIKDHLVVRCNRRLEQLFGYGRGEMVNRNTRDWYTSEEDFATVGVAAYEDLRAGGAHQRDQLFRRRDGSTFWARMSGRAFAVGADAEPIGDGSVWVVEDITDSRHAREALERAHDELEHRVVERTAELATANAQLQGEIFERMQAEERVWHLAHHDALTGLPNRSLLLDRLNQALAQGDRNVHKVAVMFLDLDRFKSINDTLGHAVGDELLKQVSQRLKAGIRAIDTVSRLGGDEFVVVLQELMFPDDATLVAEKILAALQPTVRVDEHELHVTPSIGIAVYPDDGRDAYTLLKNADTAMYHAKAAGRNNFQFFASAMNEKAARFFSIEQRLRAALDGGRLHLYYQPLVNLEDRSVCGLEALLRWDDPEQGLIAPEEFIPVAEETGLILPIGEWVLREAMAQNRRWQEEGRPRLPISVNLSPRQFRQKGLVDMIRAILAESGQPPSLLELEITESTLMHDADETLGKLRELAGMGVRLAIDDFGTGYSSLAYLKRFPVHKLKVDQSFIRDLTDNRDDAAIVAAIISLARTLGLDSIAEGVETSAQLGQLQNLGCRGFQGFYLSHPLPPERADELFEPPGLAHA